MKLIASRELSARPGAVWADLEVDGAVVITRDGLPVGIIPPTSPATLREDMQEISGPSVPPPQAEHSFWMMSLQ